MKRCSLTFLTTQYVCVYFIFFFLLSQNLVVCLFFVAFFTCETYLEKALRKCFISILRFSIGWLFFFVFSSVSLSKQLWYTNAYACMQASTQTFQWHCRCDRTHTFHAIELNVTRSYFNTFDEESMYAICHKPFFNYLPSPLQLCAKPVFVSIFAISLSLFLCPRTKKK